EVTKSYLSMVPAEYLRKQTLAGAERYITEELKTLEERVLTAHERILALENSLFQELLRIISAQLPKIQRTAAAVARLDVLASFAQVSSRFGYSRPEVDLSDEIIIKDGRHPVVERMMDGMPFVPNDTKLDCASNQIAIITGPNMAGKSTYMRQTALIVLMAQIGCFVPAKSAHIGVVDGIYTRVGASDDLSAGQSTFMVEMSEVASILKNATRRSLLILDEIGRGTSTYDGMSIARAVVEYIADQRKLGAKTLFATHYHELTELEDIISCVKNYNIAVKKRGDDITFLRRIIPGGADDSYGIEVSKLAGIPEWVIKRAHEVLSQLEEGKAVSTPKIKAKFVSDEEENGQLTLINPAGDRILERLRGIDENTVSPLEALGILFELKKMM
ncbi:MAG: DNA mismatch repair protein MutS, partial [Oscillospiraceae bacterium]|nr:DNA mismatch repair protein MutS [Oscillospiraceae bacterium]